MNLLIFNALMAMRSHLNPCDSSAIGSIRANWPTGTTKCTKTNVNTRLHRANTSDGIRIAAAHSSRRERPIPRPTDANVAAPRAGHAKTPLKARDF